jgi:hypothetical protein
MNTRRKRRTYRDAQRSRQFRAARAYLWFCVYAGMTWFFLRWITR